MSPRGPLSSQILLEPRDGRWSARGTTAVSRRPTRQGDDWQVLNATLTMKLRICGIAIRDRSLPLLALAGIGPATALPQAVRIEEEHIVHSPKLGSGVERDL